MSSTPWSPVPPEGQPQPGGQPPGYPQPGGYQPGGYPPGGYAQPGGYPPGGYAQPGGYAPGGEQPGGYPAGGYQPGGYPPGQAPQGPPQSYGPPQGYGPVTVGGPPRRSHKGRVALIAGGVVVALGLTGGGVLALTNGWFSSGGAGGASSPEAAAVSFLESAVKLDGADVLANLAPSERAVVADLVDVAGNQPKPQGQSKQAMDALQDAKDALKITLPDAPTFKAEELVPGVSKATITGGSIKIDGDVNRITDDVITIMKASGAPSYQTDDAARSSIRDAIDQQLPVQKDLTDLVSMMNLSTDGLYVVTVQEGGKWYVSASMTAAQYTAEANGVTKDQLGTPIPASEMKKFSSPQDAVTGLYDAINTTVNTGDLRELAKALPPAESRLLAVYGPVMSSGGSGGSDTQSPLSLSGLTASTLSTDGDHAYVALDSFTADAGSGVTYEYSRDGKKYTVDVKQDGDTMLSLVVDGTDPKSWKFTLDGSGQSGSGSLSVPEKGQFKGDFSITSDSYYGQSTTSGSFSFDGDCLKHSYDNGYGPSSGQTCGLAKSVEGTGLANVDQLPGLDRLLSVTTLKSGDSWYASPTATVISGFAELARTVQP